MDITDKTLDEWAEQQGLDIQGPKVRKLMLDFARAVQTKEKKQMSGWIGVDLDGTLAVYRGWNGGQIGEPVPAMVERVKAWIAEGQEVRIFTARVGASGVTNGSGVLDNSDFAEEQRTLIQAWCAEHIGVVLPVTATKDLGLVELWDDRAVRVETNTGEILSA